MSTEIKGALEGGGVYPYTEWALELIFNISKELDKYDLHFCTSTMLFLQFYLLARYVMTGLEKNK